MSPRPATLLMEDFDALPVAARPVAASCGCPRCTASATLPLCRAAAYDEGYRVGTSARTTTESRQADELAAALASAIGDADAGARDLSETTAEAIGGLVVAMVAASLPASCAALGTREVRAIAAAVLPALRTEAAITLYGAPAALDVLQAVPGQLPEPLRTRITVLADSALAAGDVQITWHAGSAQRQASAACARVMSVLATFGLVPPPGGPEGDPTAKRMEARVHG